MKEDKSDIREKIGKVKNIVNIKIEEEDKLCEESLYLILKYVIY